MHDSHIAVDETGSRRALRLTLIRGKARVRQEIGWMSEPAGQSGGHTECAAIGDGIASDQSVINPATVWCCASYMF
jgi:hypothetical protein